VSVAGGLPAVIGVAGAGTMGTGIAQLAATAGIRTLLFDPLPGAAERGAARVLEGLEGAKARGKLSADDLRAAWERIEAVDTIAGLAPCELVIEAAPEEPELKHALYAELAATVSADCILASNTSSIPITALAADVPGPERVVGMHFFNPAPVMKLVEVVSTVATADDVVATTVELCRRLGKHPVTCGDRAGFIVNALLFPYLNDAVKMLEANYATADDIDTAMKTGCGYPMGPFELLDVVGLDVSLAIQRTLYLEFREPGFAPAPRLEHLVTAGYLGRKAGRGFRAYD